MIFLLHTDTKTIHCRVDGKMFSIPPNELFEVSEIRGTDINNNGPFEYIIPEKLVAGLICSRMWHHGIVQVPMIRNAGGVQSDLPAAKQSAIAALEAAEDTMLTKYVQDQQERTTRENKPAIAPSEPLVRILKKRGLDLKKDFNIDPPGFTVGRTHQNNAEEVRALTEKNAALEAKLDKLLASLGEGEEKETSGKKAK